MNCEPKLISLVVISQRDFDLRNDFLREVLCWTFRKFDSLVVLSRFAKTQEVEVLFSISNLRPRLAFISFSKKAHFRRDCLDVRPNVLRTLEMSTVSRRGARICEERTGCARRLAMILEVAEKEDHVRS